MFLVSIPDWCDWQNIFLISSTICVKFQFQIGAIGRMKQTLFNIEPIKVSIPDWCDWQGYLCYVMFRVMLVSIPDWCDWQNRPVIQICICKMFQFQIGAIGRTSSVSPAREKARFNSRLVRLAEFSNMKNQIEYLGFNSRLVRLADKTNNTQKI